jgi:hypothetical protein
LLDTCVSYLCPIGESWDDKGVVDPPPVHEVEASN